MTAATQVVRLEDILTTEELAGDPAAVIPDVRQLALGQPRPRLVPARGHDPLPYERRRHVAGRLAGSDPGVPGEQSVTNGEPVGGSPWFPC